ncbi:MAG: hypothetical protein R6W91_06315 [Thermoplasmata archaeon]
MTAYKQIMKASAVDVAVISLLALAAFMAGWYIFGLFIAIIFWDYQAGKNPQCGQVEFGEGVLPGDIVQ